MAKISPLVLLPPILFAAVAGLFLGGMFWGSEETLPSTLVGQTAPPVPVEQLPGQPLLTDGDLRSGEVTVVNFWASWCPPCRAEHPTLLQMQADGVRVASINMRDDLANAQSYLAEEGSPFFGTGFDPRGRTSVAWGVTAPPETFIVDGDGTVLFRYAGPLIGTDYENRFLPALRDAMEKE